MPQAPHRRRINTKVAVALLLTLAAGCVDIVGYLGLYHAFTAHMTGETVHLAQNLSAAHWPDVAKTACVIASFLVGSIGGRILIEIGARTHVRRIASATLLIEAGLIAAVIPFAAGHTVRQKSALGLLAMLAAAMGIQTATLTRVGSLTVHTTFVTGMLNKLAQLLSQGLFLTYDSSQGRDTAVLRQRVFRRAQLIASIWVLYFLSAATGVWMSGIWGLRSLLVPVVIVCLTVLMDQIAPLSLEEEKDQSEL
jgi:uncharacterized membrane protein YoaK (UPF0700 family)